MINRQILIPRGLESKLRALTILNDEVTGILLYKPQGNDCPIRYLFLTGTGSADKVSTMPERLDVANEFFRSLPEYKCVEFHTHSQVTIARFGDHYADNFSSPDVRMIEQRMREDPQYIAMLITPQKMITCGKRDDPQIVVVPNPPAYEDMQRVIRESMQTIAGRKGISLNWLNVR